MIIICDTSPIRYLLLIDQIDLLPQLYGQIIIPHEVHDEMQSANAPLELQQWIANPPTWLSVQNVTIPSDDTRQLTDLSRLDLGEQAAIALAQQLNADFLIMDERLGRRFAQRRGLQVIGTLGILTEAAELGLIDLAVMIDRLKLTNFRVSQRLIQTLLQPPENLAD
jgi:predicted nucleic acid-binding protein